MTSEPSIADTSRGRYTGNVEVPEFLWNFAQDQEEISLAANDLRSLLVELAAAASIPVHGIESRPKSFTSYQQKAKKAKYVQDNRPIQDVVAARVIVYTTSARQDMTDLIVTQMTATEPKNPGADSHNGYDSIHLNVTGVNDPGIQRRYPHLTRYLAKYPGCEIQLRSVAAHAWAEYEHDVRYKSGAYADLPQEKQDEITQWFVEAGGLRKFMDQLFDNIERSLRPEESPRMDESVADGVQELATDETGGEKSQNSDPVTEATLASFIAARFSGKDIGSDSQIQEIAHQLRTLQCNTVGDVENALSAADLDDGQVAKLMDYPIQPTGVRMLDDELLATFGEQYVSAANDPKREQLLQLRLRRLRGRFAIYTIETPEGRSRPITAAHAVRYTARYVADTVSPEDAQVNEAIALNRDTLNASLHARVVETKAGTPLYVATNLSRSWAERILKALARNVPDQKIKIQRAGDNLLDH